MRSKTKKWIGILLAGLLLTGCANSVSVPDHPYPGEGSVRGEEYSDRTLIIAFEAGSKQEVLEDLCEKYDMEILYDYENFSMAAVAFTSSKSDKQMQKLIEEISVEEGVLSVERDQIMHLDEEKKK